MKIDGVKIIEPDVYTDYRGDLWTLWKSGEHSLDFNHDKVSTSRKHVLRGIHGDAKSWIILLWDNEESIKATAGILNPGMTLKLRERLDPNA